MPDSRRLAVESLKYSVPSHETHSLETSQRSVQANHIDAKFPTKNEEHPEWIILKANDPKQSIGGKKTHGIYNHTNQVLPKS